jgi:hypothetical protein
LRFEVITAAGMMSAISVVVPYNLVEVIDVSEVLAASIIRALK